MGDADKVKGTAKEVAGKATGSDELAREGQQQKKKGEKAEKADMLRDEAERKEREAAGHDANEKRHQS